jgi:hypothetical protein
VLMIAPPAGLVMNLARGWITPLPLAPARIFERLAGPDSDARITGAFLQERSRSLASVRTTRSS